MAADRDRLLDAVVAALPGWQVLVVQFNDTVARRLGVSASDLQCLFVLSRHGPCTPGAIAEHIGLTTGSASRMVDRLAAAGLVTREPDPSDRRRVLVDATPAALAQVGRHYGPMNDRLRGHLAAMTDESLKQLATFVADAEASTFELIHRDGPGS